MGKALAAQGPELDSHCKEARLGEADSGGETQLLSPWSFPSQPLRTLCLGISPGRVLVPICILKAPRSQEAGQSPSSVEGGYCWQLVLCGASVSAARS